MLAHVEKALKTVSDVLTTTPLVKEEPGIKKEEPAKGESDKYVNLLSRDE